MSPRRHFLTAAIVWAVLSVLGVVIVLGWQIIPVIASKEAKIENSAFVLLTVLSVPVLAPRTRRPMDRRSTATPGSRRPGSARA